MGARRPGMAPCCWPRRAAATWARWKTSACWRALNDGLRPVARLDPPRDVSIPGITGAPRASMVDRNRAEAGFGPVLLRVLLGTLFIAHLYWKIAVLPGGLPAWWSGLAKSGYPAFVPAYVLSAELAGALLLIPGVMARYAALYAMPM